MYEQPATQPHKPITKRTMWGLILLIGPSALGILSLLVSYVVSYYISPQSDTAQSVVQIIAFLLNGIVGITWVPGVVLGIILLATKPSQTQPLAVPQTGLQGAEQPTQYSPQQLPNTPEQSAQLLARKRKYLTWALVLLIAPAVCGIIAVILLFTIIYIGVNGIGGDVQIDILTVFTLITGGIAFIGFIPGIVLGVILLSKRSSIHA